MIRRQRGFTLLELLVVVAIITILAAILFPVFAQAREKARQAVCLSSLKQWGTAALMYTQDYDDHFPRWFRQIPKWNPGAGFSMQTGWHTDGYYWHEAILPYIRNYDTLLCPSAQGALNPFCLPYGWNRAYVHDNSQVEYPYPAETILIADGRGRLTLPADRSTCKTIQARINQPCADCIDEGRYIYAHIVVPSSATASDYPVSGRHQGKAGLLFMDGHVRSVDAAAVNACNNYWDGDGLAGDCRKGARSPRFSAN